jgi:hypothetical protein
MKARKLARLTHLDRGWNQERIWGIIQLTTSAILTYVIKVFLLANRIGHLYISLWRDCAGTADNGFLAGNPFLGMAG